MAAPDLPPGPTGPASPPTPPAAPARRGATPGKIAVVLSLVPWAVVGCFILLKPT